MRHCLNYHVINVYVLMYYTHSDSKILLSTASEFLDIAQGLIESEDKDVNMYKQCD